MRKVDRASVAEPASLSGPSDSVSDEKARAGVFYSTYIDGAKFEFKEYKAHDVKVALRELFGGNCAYCESDLGDNLEVEHFRPKGGVTEEPLHVGYWWFAHSWDNLLPSCIPCNRKRAQHIISEETTPDAYLKMIASRPRSYYGKANFFPISGVRAFSKDDAINQELPNLLDPTVDDPSHYLQWVSSSEYSLVLPKTSNALGLVRAQATINHFALNRLRLVQSRTKLLTILKTQAGNILAQLAVDSKQDGGGAGLLRALASAAALGAHAQAGQPYSAMASAFIDQLIIDLKSHPVSAG